MRSGTRHLGWLGALLACGAVAAAVAAALLLGWRAGSSPVAPVAPVAGASVAMATQIDLGRAMCGECCTGAVWRAVGNMPGVADVVAKAGEKSIVVHHDGRAGAQQAMVASLMANSFPEASVRAEPAAAVPPPRQWIRPVPVRNPQ